VLCLVASFITIVIYHLGYPESRSEVVFEIGGGQFFVTLTYLLTNNPLSAILSHIAMHVAVVLHEPATVMQLPPLY
jgi:hypothetical protein